MDTMAQCDALPRLPVKARRMCALTILCITMLGLLHPAAAARQLQEATLPTLAGERSTWAPATQYAQQRITFTPTNLATVAAAAPAVFGVQQPANSIVLPTLNNAPMANSYGGPGAGFPNINNLPVITAKPGNAAVASVPGFAAPTQLPTASSLSTSSGSDMSANSRARLAAGAAALPVSSLGRLSIPSVAGLANVASSIGNTASQGAAAAGAGAGAATLNPSQLVAIAAVGAQKFVQDDLPKLIQTAAKDPNVQKGIENLLKDLGDGKIDLPKNLGEVAKQLNLGLPDGINEGLSSIKLPEGLTELKLPEPLKPGQLPKLDLPRLNIPGFGPGTIGPNGFNFPQIPGLTRNNNMLSGTRWTNPPIPEPDQYGMTGVKQLDAAKMMLGAAVNKPVDSDNGAVNSDANSGELGTDTFQGADRAASIAAGAAANRIKHNQQEDKGRRQQRAAALRVRDGIRINANSSPADKNQPKGDGTADKHSSSTAPAETTITTNKPSAVAATTGSSIDSSTLSGSSAGSKADGAAPVPAPAVAHAGHRKGGARKASHGAAAAAAASTRAEPGAVAETPAPATTAPGTSAPATTASAVTAPTTTAPGAKAPATTAPAAAAAAKVTTSAPAPTTATPPTAGAATNTAQPATPPAAAAPPAAETTPAAAATSSPAATPAAVAAPPAAAATPAATPVAAATPAATSATAPVPSATVTPEDTLTTSTSSTSTAESAHSHMRHAGGDRL